jgi:hypothetical protein
MASYVWPFSLIPWSFGTKKKFEVILFFVVCNIPEKKKKKKNEF